MKFWCSAMHLWYRLKVSSPLGPHFATPLVIAWWGWKLNLYSHEPARPVWHSHHENSAFTLGHTDTNQKNKNCILNSKLFLIFLGCSASLLSIIVNRNWNKINKRLFIYKLNLSHINKIRERTLCALVWKKFRLLVYLHKLKAKLIYEHLRRKF